LRQCGGVRDPSPVDEHGDDPDVARERCLDLEPDEVARVVDASQPAAVLPAAGPSRADDRQEHRTRSDRFVDLGDEVVPGTEGVDVHEDPAGPQPIT
jgi:hypothetical protein